MDAVITYVNGQDSLWLADYRKYVDGSVNVKRFRDWGTLRYLLRGIEKNMPFVRNVYLVVARESQVPEWVDTTRLHIVLHSEIIPAEYLPTFNSNTIELFLHRIPGLDEQFLYFNDDMFPVSECRPEDFYVNGSPVVHHSHCIFAFNLFKKMVRNTDRKARIAAGVRNSILFVRPQHTVYASLKSSFEEVFSLIGGEINASFSICRQEKNLIHYLFSDYLYFKGRTFNKRISNKHFSIAAASGKKISAFLSHPDRKMVCINDVNISRTSFEDLREQLLSSFETLFPRKSSFEL